MMETVPRLRACRKATLAEVYDLDMGYRREDLPAWGAILRDEAPARPVVVEVGCGTGRVPVGLDLLLTLQRDRQLHLPERWVGMDPDQGMVDRFLARTRAEGLGWASAIAGDARDPSAWQAAQEAAGGAIDLVAVPYMTLFLLPHDDQVAALRLAAGVLAVVRGLVVFEVFSPTMLTDGEHSSTRRCRDPDGGTTWVRRTRFRVDASRRVTEVERLYGPANSAGLLAQDLAVFRVEERIHWRMPDEMPTLLKSAGLRLIDMHPGGALRGLVPAGSVFVVAGT